MSASSSTGLLDTLRSFAASLLSNAHNRVELFSLELQEEKFRLIQVFVWISATVFAAAMAVAFASITLVYLFWESARLAVLGGLTVFYVATLVVLLIAFRRYLKQQPRPFSATLGELQQDRTCIHPEN
jgi:uncharacterized membrane protein YqjE